MPQPLLDDGIPTYDVVGVGFGPSNLALAVAVTEHNADEANEPVTAHFLERQQGFGWHRGMLIEDATMQVSFLKDLVTLRDPASRFSFLCYLKEQGRLVDFVNQKNLFPLRVEFHEYFEWAAAQVDDMVSYGHEVVAVRPVLDGDRLAFFDVRTAGGEVYRARNLALATGLRPRLPEGVSESEHVWHNSSLLHRVSEVGEASRFVVVGAGQSAAEVTAYLHDRFADAEVCAVFSRFGYTPSDDSAFANRIFDPDTVDEFYGASEEARQKLLDYHANTNYSVVDLELIDDLYRRLYREKVLGTQRLRIFNASRAVDVAETGAGARVGVESMTTGERAELDADVVVYATGYRHGELDPLSGELAGYCLHDEHGRPRLARDYRVRTAPEIAGGIYLQGGGTEHTHGITSSLLSNNAVRSGEILESILKRRAVGRDRNADFAVSAMGDSVGGRA